MPEHENGKTAVNRQRLEGILWSLTEKVSPKDIKDKLNSGLSMISALHRQMMYHTLSQKLSPTKLFRNSSVVMAFLQE